MPSNPPLRDIPQPRDTPELREVPESRAPRRIYSRVASARRLSDRRLVFGVLAWLGCVLFPASVEATPRYSARYQQTCNLCHQNPTGGGMRSAYAAQFLVPMELAVMETPEERVALLDPQVTPAFSIGADLRTLFLYAEEKPHRENFFQMQGTLYAHFQPSPDYAIYLAQGQSQTRELFGIGYVLPRNGYVKVGRFVPPYGWKLDDHTAYVRDRLGFAPPAQTDVGVELGAFPGAGSEFQIAVTNGAGGSILDTDHRVAGFGRAVLRQRVLGASVAAGASFAYSESGLGVLRQGGPFGSFHAGFLTWVGELDLRRDPGSGLDGLVTSQEITFELRRGLGLRFLYDFHDPDVDSRTGTSHRYSVGVNALIHPFLGVQALAVWRDPDPGPAVAGEAPLFQPRLLVHFLY